MDEGLLQRDPSQDLRVRPVRREARRVLSEAAVQEIFAAASLETRAGGRPVALRDRAVLELLYGLGLRASEARSVRVVDLDLVWGTLLVRPAKRGKPRALPLPPASVPHLEVYLRQGRPALVRPGDQDRGVFLLGRSGAPLRGSQVQKLVKAVAQRAGYGDVSPHDFRRALATHLSRRGVSVLAIQHLLGHGSVASTQVYLSLDVYDLRRAIRVLDVGHE